jgi:hypothetical protein
VNALRDSPFDTKQETILSIIAYGGEGLYYFVEQFVWLAKSGLIYSKHSKSLGKVSAWAEFVGYIGSISLKFRDLKKLSEDEVSGIEHWSYCHERSWVSRGREEIVEAEREEVDEEIIYCAGFC